MRNAMILLVVVCSVLFQPETALAQSYTTESKACGSCGKEVSIHSRVGMTCPHCGVRWGYENQKSTTRKETYESYPSAAYTTSVANLRAKPSKSAIVLMVLPAWTNVSVLSRNGDWLYISYGYYDQLLKWRTINGYVHKSLLK